MRSPSKPLVDSRLAHCRLKAEVAANPNSDFYKGVRYALDVLEGREDQ